MIKESFFIKLLISIFIYFKNSWFESKLYSFYSFLAKTFTKFVNESKIISFLSSDWDKGLKENESSFISKIIEIINYPSSKISKSEKGIAKLLKESFLISLASPNLLLCVVYFIFFSIPFLPTMVLLGFCLIALALYFLNIFMGKIKYKKKGILGVFLILFALSYIISSLTSGNISQSLKVMGVFIVFMSMTFVVSDCINTEKRLNTLINIFIISAVLVSLYGIYQYLTGAEMDAAWVDSDTFGDITTRVYATFTNPNVLGEYLIVTTLLCIGMFWQEKRLPYKLYYLFLSGVLGICLIFTNSRGSMLGLILAAVFFVLLSEKRLIILGVMGILALPFIIPESL